MFFMSYQLVCLLANILMAFLHFPCSSVFFFFFLKVTLAEKTAVLFTKDGDQHNNLYDMQCMWYISLLD